MKVAALVIDHALCLWRARCVEGTGPVQVRLLQRHHLGLGVGDLLGDASAPLGRPIGLRLRSMPLAPFSVLIHMVWLPDLYHRSASVPISTAPRALCCWLSILRKHLTATNPEK
jgi:hypothetical protein